MTQTRLYVSTDSAAASRLFAALETAFEEDGYPIAIVDTDEARGIKEVSLYTDDDADGAEAACAPCWTKPASTPRSAAKSLPDIDWVAQFAGGPAAGPRRTLSGARLA